ncbi:7787_t:CDS:2, partial [Entrophospora sp. SA101]
QVNSNNIINNNPSLNDVGFSSENYIEIDNQDPDQNSSNSMEFIERLIKWIKSAPDEEIPMKSNQLPIRL